MLISPIMISQVCPIPLMTMTLAITCLIILMILLTQVTEASTIQTKSIEPEYSDFDQQIVEKFFDDEYKKGKHNGGRVYYAHSMMMYGTEDKQIKKELIRDVFDNFGIVSPKYYEDNPQRMMDDMEELYNDNDGKRIEEMEFYKMIVSSCQLLVYSKLNDEIPSGVAIEVNHAIGEGIPVFEIVDDKFIPQKVPVDGMTRQETIELYEEY